MCRAGEAIGRTSPTQFAARAIGVPDKYFPCAWLGGYFQTPRSPNRTSACSRRLRPSRLRTPHPAAESTRVDLQCRSAVCRFRAARLRLPAAPQVPSGSPPRGAASPPLGLCPRLRLRRGITRCPRPCRRRSIRSARLRIVRNSVLTVIRSPRIARGVPGASTGADCSCSKVACRSAVLFDSHSAKPAKTTETTPVIIVATSCGFVSRHQSRKRCHRLRRAPVVSTHRFSRQQARSARMDGAADRSLLADRLDGT